MYFQAKDYSPVPAETKVAFIGLGTMGFPMAGHLLHAGCQVTVYNRTASKAQAWVEKFGGKAVTTPREAAQDADVVFTCVGNDNDLRSVLLGEDGAFAGMKKTPSFGTPPQILQKSLKKWRLKLTPAVCTLLTHRYPAARTAQSAAVLPSCAAEMQKSLNVSNRLRTLLRARFAESDRSAPDSLPRCAIRSVSPALFRA